MSTLTRAHVVGSMLRPPELLQAFQQLRAGTIDVPSFKRIEDRAVDQAIAIQERCGIDVVTDGEQRRLAFGDVFGQSVAGIEPVKAEAVGRHPMWKGGDETSRQLEINIPTGGIIVDKLRRADSKASEEFVYARARAQRPVKVTLPAPTLLMASWSAERSRHVYPSFAAALDDVTDILRQEVRALARLGCTQVQFDAPEVTFAIEGESSLMLRFTGMTREAFCALVVERLNAVADTPGIEYSVHFCRGNARGHWHSSGGYGSIAPLVFPKLSRFKYVLLEYDSERCGGFEPLGQLPRACCAVLGLLTTKHGELESREALRARIDEAAHHFPRDQLALSPQCGFAGDSGGNAISPAEEEAKLRRTAEVAHELLR